MTPTDASQIAALDELGLRFDEAIARPRRWRSRRALAVAVGLVVLAGTPAVASMTGILGGASRFEEALPAAAAAVVMDDAPATARALERLGFDVTWMLIEDDPHGPSPTKGRTVTAPPPGTEILSVLAPDGSPDLQPGTRRLLIEVSPSGSDILATHD